MIDELETEKTKVERWKKSVTVSDMSPKKLSRELARQSTLIFNAGLVKAEAEAKKGSASAALKVMRAKIYEMYKNKQKMTEKELEHMVTKHPKVCRTAKRYNRAKYNFNVALAYVSAMKTKGDMLQALAYNYRKELDTIGHSKIREKSVEHKVRNWNKER